MKRRRFGPTHVDVPVIGQGTWKLRRPDRAEAALRLGLDLGLAHIDTAELYRGSEEIVARTIKGRRDEVFLVSKVLPTNASHEGTLAACERSLRRLETDQLDVYLLHWPSDQHPVSETMRAMGELVDQGKTRFVGVSNFSVDELDEAQSALGTRRIACDQVFYSLEARNLENELLPYCRKKGIAIVGYSPFGSRNFPAADSTGGRALAEVSRQTGLTPYQVVLNFLSRDPGIFLIPKAETETHVRENAAALDAELGPADVRLIDETFPRGRSPDLPYV